ncbi:S-layer homology domain-containing protein [Fictibacillus phosphorivorans]|uniref:C40 family peptidase n=1 Tax=Fictibacillus phosphorivorans TaxID=1221500 RepID=UPI00203B87EE|nr:S-layer homology domain-containing protein [Fictibacillus phosphorivorans]MCM3776125.1 S-layer homology domain-containing protein [Fictibacillus phosphorivorans]
MVKKLGAWILSLLTVLALLPGQADAGEREDIVTTAKKYIGIKYTYGGTSPSTGFDCSGFTSYVYKQHAKSLPRTVADQYKGGTNVKKAELEQGDLVFFATTSSSASHAGIYVGSGNFIHASSSKGIMISSINDPYYWGSRYLGARRYLAEEEKVANLAVLPKGQYHDVPTTHWAYSPITSLSKKGVMNGYAYSLFKPAQSVTRAEAAAMVANALNIDAPSNYSSFKDVSTSYWAVGSINAVKEAGIIAGYPDGTFKPNKVMTREEIAALIDKTFVLTNKGTEKSFTDVKEGYWAYNSIQRLSENKIAAGFSDNTYRPLNETSRAEFSTFLYRAITTLAVK